MSRRRKDRKTRQARGRPNSDGQKVPPAGTQGLRADASVLEPRHMLFLHLHRLHTGKSVEEIAASFGLDTEGLRERLEYTERTLDKILPAGNNTHERIRKFAAMCELDEAGKNPA